MTKKINTKIDVAVIRNDLKWIKDVLKKIDENMEKIQGCVSVADNRIQRLEDWKKFCENEWNKNMAKWGLLIGFISIVVSVLIALYL